MYLYDLFQLCLLLNKTTCFNSIDYYMYLLIRCGEHNHNNISNTDNIRKLHMNGSPHVEHP